MQGPSGTGQCKVLRSFRYEFISISELNISMLLWYAQLDLHLIKRNVLVLFPPDPYMSYTITIDQSPFPWPAYPLRSQKVNQRISHH